MPTQIPSLPRKTTQDVLEWLVAYFDEQEPRIPIEEGWWPVVQGFRKAILHCGDAPMLAQFIALDLLKLVDWDRLPGSDGPRCGRKLLELMVYISEGYAGSYHLRLPPSPCDMMFKPEQLLNMCLSLDGDFHAFFKLTHRESYVIVTSSRLGRGQIGGKFKFRINTGLPSDSDYSAFDHILCSEDRYEWHSCQMLQF